MVLDEDVDVLLAGLGDQVLVVGKLLDGRLCEKNVDAALNGVKSNWVVARVWGEDGDGVSGLEQVDCGLVGIRVLGVIGGIGLKRGIEAVVCLCDILMEVFT